ncbi:unnamed protein product, partial [Gulo gulo]
PWPSSTKTECVSSQDFLSGSPSNTATAITSLYKEAWRPISEILTLEFRLALSYAIGMHWLGLKISELLVEISSTSCVEEFPHHKTLEPPWPRLSTVSPNIATSAETSSSVQTDLQPFWKP